MKTKIWLVLIIIIALGLGGFLVYNNSSEFEEEITNTEIKQEKSLINKENTNMFANTSQTKIKIIDVYNNEEYDSEFKTGFGFAAVIEINDTVILFDTGGDSPTLLSNLETAGIKPEEIDTVFLSHIHGDHTDGLLGFLEKNSKVKVYLPVSFPSYFKNQITSTGAEIIEVEKSIQVSESIYSAGELGTSIKEQSLVIDSEKGLIIITGCAHPGIVNIVREAKELLNKNIYLVMGGFHLSSASNSQIESIVDSFKELEVAKAAPSHCTGTKARNLFKEEYGENFIESGVGKVIEIK